MADVSFQLDIKGGEDILVNMVAPVIKQSADAIAERARAMAGSISSQPPAITVSAEVRPSSRGGSRITGVIRAQGKDAHQNYVGHVALAKAKDAGRV